MEKYSEITEKFITKVLDTLEKTNNSKAIVDMAEDLGLGLRFKVLAEQIVEHALKENKMINSFFLLKSVSRNPDQRANPEGIGYAGTGDKNPEDYEELTNGVTLFKGPLIKMLDKMRLVKSRAELVKGVVMKDDEITPSQIYTQEELDNFDASDFELVLKEELEEKYSEKPVVISPE